MVAVDVTRHLVAADATRQLVAADVTLHLMAADVTQHFITIVHVYYGSNYQGRHTEMYLSTIFCILCTSLCLLSS